MSDSNQNIPYPIYRGYQDQNRVFSELLGYAATSSPIQVGESSRVVSVQLTSSTHPELFHSMTLSPPPERCSHP